jgi:hypothetical protein
LTMRASNVSGTSRSLSHGAGWGRGQGEGCI